MAGRRRGNDLGLLLLGYELMRFGVDRVAPVTLGTIILNAVAYKFLPFNVRGTCISAYNVWHLWDVKRLVIGALDHGDDFHLYYNMISLLWKGNSLERRLKSPYFAYILVVFTILTSITMVGINTMLSILTDQPSYFHQCAVGFSGVLFALKVLTTYYNPPGTQYVMGFIPVPSKWIFWAELILIQVLVPNASFTGHLAGILVGLAYIHGPLKYIMDMFIPRAPSYSYRSASSGYRSQSNANRHSGWDNYGPGFTTGSSTPYSSSNRRANPSAPPEPSPTDSQSPPAPGWRFTGTEPTYQSQTEDDELRRVLERSQWER